MPSAVGKALNAATGEIGDRTLWEAARAHADRGQLKRFHEIKKELKAELGGGNIVKGPKADEFKKRLQAEGLIPNGKAKSVDDASFQPFPVRAPGEKVPGLTQAVKEVFGINPREKATNLTQKVNDAFGIRKNNKPDPLYGNWDKGQLQEHRQFLLSKAPAGAKRDEQIARIDKELARKDEKGSWTKDIMAGDSSIRTLDAKSLAAGFRRENNRMAGEAQVKEDVAKILRGQKTNADERTLTARAGGKDLDDKIEGNITARYGKKDYDFGPSLGPGSKRLGAGAFGTVMKEPGPKGNAVKRGELGEDEAKLIDKVGKAGLGPKLITAQLDGPGIAKDTKVGRLSMEVLKGKPMGDPRPEDEIGGVKVADAYWRGRAELHRLGVAHGDMHGDNVFIGSDGKAKFVDMGLAQDSRKAALSEAMGAFEKPAGSQATRQMWVRGDGDWQARRWRANGGSLLGSAERTNSASDVKELKERAPVLAKVRENKAIVWREMIKDGFTTDDIATIMDHGIRAPKESYKYGPWAKMSDDQAKKYIDVLYDGV